MSLQTIISNTFTTNPLNESQDGVGNWADFCEDDWNSHKGTVNDWETLADDDVELDLGESIEDESVVEPPEPAEKPESPRVVLKEEATMEIVVIETKRYKNPNRPTMGPRRRKVKATKMSRGDFFAMCEREDAAKIEAAKPSPQTLKNREKKARQKANREKGWTAVAVKAAPLQVSIKFPRKASPRKPPAQGKFVNTTLVLKNLPYEGVVDKALKAFFSKTCGPVRFVNVLREEDGKAKGLAFVRFVKREGSDKGFQLNKFFYEGREIYVDYARDNRK